ncbi:MAG: hypothetical protein WD851_07790 [Pirellulales bacterium]
MHRKSFRQVVAAVLLAIFATGCSYGPPMGDVQGKVTLNGQPLTEGAVRFIPVNGDTPATGGSIRAGSFRVEVPVAEQRVEISANVVDREKTPPNATNDEIVMKMLVPERYNTQSELTLDVVPGLNEPVYNLTNP